MNTKKLFVWLLLPLLYACSSADNQTESASANAASSTASIVETSSNTETTALPEVEKTYGAFAFEKTEHNFGEIKQGEIVKHTFRFTNAGEAPLLISKIETTCGCTTPNYTREPIAPGQSGEIEVEFNSAGKAGMQNKVITIYANTKNQRETISINTSVQVAQEISGPYKVQ